MSAYGDCDLCHKGGQFLTRCVMCGIEILACDECQQVENVIPEDNFKPIGSTALQIVAGLRKGAA